MAIGLAQTTITGEIANASNPQTLTFGSTTTTGHFLAWAFSYNGGGVDTTSISDNKANSFTPVLNQLGANSKTRLRVWRVTSGAVGSSHQFSLNPGGSSDQGVHWGVMEFNTDVDVSTMIDTASASATGTCAGADASATSGSPTNGNVMLVGFAATRGNFGTVNLNTPSTWTNVRLQNTATGGIGSSVCRKSVTVSGNSAQSVSFTHDGSDSSIDWVSGIVIVREASSVTVTDVDTDETITADQTNVVVTGTGFGSSQGAGSVTIRQGTTSVTQTIDSWSATSIQFDVVFDSTTDLKHGAATLRVTENGGAYGELPITINPPSGWVYVDLTTPNLTSSYRITASGDLASGDQVRGRGLNGNSFPSGHTINADATITLDSGVTGVAFEVSAWDASDSTWGAWARQDIDPNPISVAPPVGALTLSGLAPTVALGDNQRVAVPVGSLAVTGYAPTVAVTTGAQTVVPPVTGLTRTEASAEIVAAGLVEAAFFYFDSAAVNTVLAQSPAAGTIVDEDSTVEIRVSVGTEASNVVQRVGKTKFRPVLNRTKFRVA